MENEQATDRQLITPAAYARHRGCSKAAVTKAKKSGRLQRSIVVKDAGGYLVDVQLADEEWRNNTDVTRAPMHVRERADVAATGSGHVDPFADVTEEALAGLRTFEAERFSVITVRGRILFSIADGAIGGANE